MSQFSARSIFSSFGLLRTFSSSSSSSPSSSSSLLSHSPSSSSHSSHPPPGGRPPTTPPVVPLDPVRQFLDQRGYRGALAEGIISTVAQAGSDNLLQTLKDLAGSGSADTDRLQDIARAIAREVAETEGKARIPFTVRGPKDATLRCEGWEDQSLYDYVKDGTGPNADALASWLECACSGNMACSTCQVYVDAPWQEKVGKASTSEQDMIDLAYEPRPNSRLGCQLVLRPGLKGLSVEVPGKSHNLFDSIPFEDKDNEIPEEEKRKVLEALKTKNAASDVN